MFLRVSVLLLAVYTVSVVAPPPDHLSGQHSAEKEIEAIFRHYDDHLCPHMDNIDCTIQHHGPMDGRVCATDLVTYPTHCDFAKAHCQNRTLIVRHEGACDVIPGGTPSGIVYTEEQLKYFHHQIDEVYKHNNFDSCPIFASFDCTQQHLKHDETLCATDMKTYKGHCVFAKAMCNDRSLTLRHEGPCDVMGPVNPTGVDPAFAVIKGVFCKNINLITCGDVVTDPVCGNDGVLYISQCLFSKTKCFKTTLEETDMTNCAPLSSTVAPVVTDGTLDN